MHGVMVRNINSTFRVFVVSNILHDTQHDYMELRILEPVYIKYTHLSSNLLCVFQVHNRWCCIWGGGLRTPHRCVRFDKIQRNLRKKKNVGYLQHLLQITTVFKLHCIYASLISDIYIVYSYYIKIVGMHIFRFSIATFQIIIFSFRDHAVVI